MAKGSQGGWWAGWSRAQGARVMMWQETGVEGPVLPRAAGEVWGPPLQGPVGTMGDGSRKLSSARAGQELEAPLQLETHQGREAGWG